MEAGPETETDKSAKPADKVDEGPEDAETAERKAIIEQMKEYPEDVQFKAKALLTFSTAHGVWPPTLDGCNHLVETMADLMKE
jgi:hypothetical protein